MQTGDTHVFPFSGQLIGDNNDEHFQLEVGQIFGIDDEGKAYYPDKEDADQTAFFTVAEKFDSRKHSAIAGFMPGKAAPIILQDPETPVAAGVNLGLSDDGPGFAAHVPGEMLLATSYLATANGRTQALTKMELTDAPEEP